MNSAHHPAPLSPVERRVAALQALLTERGLVPEGFIEEITRRYESEIGPMNGAKVVARAWADPGYKQRLLADGTAAIAELGFGGPEGHHMVVVENTATVHNVIVCTLCSCYPWPVLGLPPAWTCPAATASWPSTLPGKAPCSRSRLRSSNTPSAATGNHSGTISSRLSLPNPAALTGKAGPPRWKRS
jgi:hypothetical protein